MGFQEPTVIKKQKKVKEEKEEEESAEDLIENDEEESTEEESTEEEQEPEQEYLVLKELPVQPVRTYKDPETGKVTNLSTMEESLTNIEKELKKLTGGL